MSTERQIAANRANSKKSTGPKTDEGKAKSSANHLSHGFTSSATIIMPGEDPEEFKALLDGFALEYQPQTQTEQILVEQMATNQWLSLRAFRLQGFAFLGESLKGDNFAIPKDLGLLIRYKTAADNAFHRAHNELVKIQKERKKSEIGFESQDASTHPQTASINVPITWAQADFPAEPAASDPDIAPEHNSFVKNAA